MNLRSIDLFCGAGGLTEGFKSAGFMPIFANDHEAPALATYRVNHPESIATGDDIELIDESQLRGQLGLRTGELDVLLGGPPCQGFSTYGQRNPHDLRNRLYQHFMRFLAEFRPKTFVMENVIGILSMDRGRVVEDINEQVTSFGYGVNTHVLDAVDFGVPQFRKRVFVVGAAEGALLDAPIPTHSPNKDDPSQQELVLGHEVSAPLPAVSVRDAIEDLPAKTLPPRATHEEMPYPEGSALSDYQRAMRDGSHVLAHHSAKLMLGTRRLRLALLRPGDYGATIRRRIAEGGLPKETIDELLNGTDGTSMRNVNQARRQDRAREERLRQILQEGHVDLDDVLASLDAGGFANKYRRLEWDRPSHTLVAHMARDCSDFVHPVIDRFISVREAARLQSFQDTYRFTDSQFRQFRSIGNAVPPRLASAVARQVTRFLGESDDETYLASSSRN